MAFITAATRTDLVELAVGMLNEAPSATLLTKLIDIITAGGTLSDAAEYIATTDEFKAEYPSFQTARQYATEIFDKIITGGTLDAAVRTAVIDLAESWLTDGKVTKAGLVIEITKVLSDPATLLHADFASIAQSFTNRSAAAEYYTVDKELGGSTAAERAAAIASVTSDAATLTTAKAAADTAANVVPGQTFTLTTGIDKAADFTGGAGADTFVGSKADGTNYFTSLDALDGGAGTDTLDIAVTANIDTATAVGATVKNIENVNITSTGTVTADTSSWTGVETLTTGSTGNSAITAATTTDVVATAASVTGANAMVVNGGKDVTATVTDKNAADTASGNTSTVGVTTQATGAINFTQTETFVASANTAASALATGTIRVDGGTSVNVNSLAVAGTGDDAGDINTIGQVTVNGKGTVTDVTVTQSAATAAYAAAGDKQKITNGAVVITDNNTADKADTISTVTLTNFGNSTFDGNVLSTLNLNGGASIASGTLDITQSAGVTTAGSIPTELTMNVTGKVGAVTDVSNQYTTLNIAAASAATVADLDFSNVTALNLSGDGALTISALTDLAKVTSITANAGGTTITPALATGVAFTGGAGKDSIVLGASTKAITMGAGDDSVKIGAAALGTGGSVDAGEGTDTLTMTAANAVTASATNTFAGTISNFEKLSIEQVGATGTVDLSKMDAINDVTVAGVDNAKVLTLSNALSGVTLRAADGTQTATTVSLASNGSADVANVNLTTADNASTHTLITLTGFETINIDSADTDSDTTAALNTITTLTDADATAINVTGNAGLKLGTFSGTKLTSFDASAATGATTYTTGALAAAATLKGGSKVDTLNAAAATKAVTLEGNAGNDVLTGSATAGSSIDGGAGDDSLIGGAAADTIIGGDGTDTFTFSSANVAEQAGSGTTTGAVINLSADALTASAVYTATGAYLSSAGTTVASGSTAYLYNNESTTNAVVNDTLTGIENVVGTNLADYIVGSAGKNSITGGTGADRMTGGDGVDTFVFGLEDSVAASASSLTGGGIAANDTITFGNGVDIITDFTAGSGGDVLDLDDTSVAGGLATLIGTNPADLADAKVFFASGTYTASTGVFKILADGAGADTLILSSDDAAVGGSDAVTTNTNMIVLVGVDSDDFTLAANLA